MFWIPTDIFRQAVELAELRTHLHSCSATAPNREQKVAALVEFTLKSLLLGAKNNILMA